MILWNSNTNPAFFGNRKALPHLKKNHVFSFFLYLDGYRNRQSILFFFDSLNFLGRDISSFKLDPYKGSGVSRPNSKWLLETSPREWICVEESVELSVLRFLHVELQMYVNNFLLRVIYDKGGKGW